MYEGLDTEQLPSALEALLFVTNEPVNAMTLAEMLEVDTAEVVSALEKLRLQLEGSNRGIQLVEIAGGWRLYTHSQFDGLLEKYVLSWDTRKMSQAALEVLAIIAYGQPMTRAQVAGIRGVNSDGVIGTLIDRGLVREAGISDTPGNPVLYGTTTVFLEKFGLSSPKALPDLEEFAPDEKTAQLIRERLGATSAANESSVGVDGAGASELVSEATGDALGVVDKIDFDSLTFDMDSE
jgi:segregation and condensation protein B